MITQLNGTFQIPLFADTSLWGDIDGDAAKRLKMAARIENRHRCQLPSLCFGKWCARFGCTGLLDGTLQPQWAPDLYFDRFCQQRRSFVLLSVEKNEGLNLANLTNPNDFMQKVGKDLNAAVKSDADIINAQLTAVLGTSETPSVWPQPPIVARRCIVGIGKGMPFFFPLRGMNMRPSK